MSDNSLFTNIAQHIILYRINKVSKLLIWLNVLSQFANNFFLGRYPRHCLGNMVRISSLIQNLEEQGIPLKYEESIVKMQLKSVNNIKEAKSDEMAFCKYEGDKGIMLINSSKGGFIFCKDTLSQHNFTKSDSVLCFVTNPRKEFIKFYNAYFTETPINKIHESAIIDNTAQIGENVNIGRLVTIGSNVIVGRNSIIYDGVNIYDGVKIGENCIIHSGTVIGSDGFGFERDDEGNVLKFPHIGNIKIGNNVEIGSNTCIDRGGLTDTIIEDNVKIDNLVHVAHNVKVGKGSFLIALSMIGGSVKIGENVWVAPSASIINGIKIGDNSTLGMGSVVLREVEEGKTVIGVPAKPINS